MKLFSLFNSTLFFYFSFAVFRIVLDVSYMTFVHPFYNDHFLRMGLNFEISRYSLSWILYLISFFVLRKNIYRVSDLFFVSVVLIIIAPITSLFGLDSSRDFAPVGATIISYIIANFLVLLKFKKNIKLPFFKKAQTLLINLSIIFVAYLIIWSVVSGAVRNINFNPDLVYYFRSEAHSMLDIGLLAYFNSWVYKFFTIFLICHFLIKRNYIYVFILIAIQIYFYGITSHKSVFFAPFIVIALWLFFSRTNRSIYWVLFFITFVIISNLAYTVFAIDDIAAMLIRRTFYVPAGLTFEWFTFFSEHRFVFWSNTFLSWLSSSSYDLSVPHTVGEFLIDSTVSANSGLVGAGFAQAGYLGVLVYIVVLALFLRIIDNLSQSGVALWVAITISYNPLVTAITSSDLLTTILSHGLMLAVVILFMYREPTNQCETLRYAR